MGASLGPIMGLKGLSNNIDPMAAGGGMGAPRGSELMAQANQPDPFKSLLGGIGDYYKNRLTDRYNNSLIGHIMPHMGLGGGSGQGIKAK